MYVSESRDLIIEPFSDILLPTQESSKSDESYPNQTEQGQIIENNSLSINIYYLIKSNFFVAQGLRSLDAPRNDRIVLDFGSSDLVSSGVFWNATLISPWNISYNIKMK